MIRLSTTLAFALAALVAAVGVLRPPIECRAADLDDLTAIRRVILPPERVPAELERIKAGGMKLLPRTEFEDLVARAQRPPRESPVLLRAVYRARLEGNDLTGSAEWTIRNAAATAALLNIDPLQLALRDARWGANRPAVLGDLTFKSRPGKLELLVDSGGEHKLEFDWSARGVAEPEGIRFDLRIPMCGLTTIELDLPAHRTLAGPRDGSSLSGPLSGATPDRSIWRLVPGRSTAVDFTIQSTAHGSAGPPTVLAGKRSSVEFSGPLVNCEFSFDVEVLRGSLRDLTLECDRSFEPMEIAVRNLESWSIRSSPGGNRKRIDVRLREPATGGSLTLRGFMPVAAESRWTVPAVVLEGAIDRGEVITIRVPADIAADDWRLGDFSIADSSGTSDGAQTLTLRSDATGRAANRPVARVRRDRIALRVVERFWWSVESRRSVVHAHLEIEPTRGATASITAAMPAGWKPSRVEPLQGDLAAIWKFEPGPVRGTLHFELTRPIRPGRRFEAKLTMERDDSAGSERDWPAIDVADAVARDGFVAIRFSPAVGPLSGMTTSNYELRPDERLTSPWGAVEPSAVIALTGFNAGSSVETELVDSRNTIRGHCEADYWPSRIVLRQRLTIRSPAPGATRILIVDPLAPHSSEGWRVVSGLARIRSVTPIGVEGILSLLSQPMQWPALSPPSAWRLIELNEPPTEPFELESQFTLALQPDSLPELALCRVAGVGPIDWQVTARAHPATGHQIVAEGALLQEGEIDRHQRRIFTADGPVTAIRLAPGDPGRGPKSWLRSTLVVDATTPGRLNHLWSGEAYDLKVAALSVDLPTGTRLVRARINNREIGTTNAADSGKGTVVFDLPHAGGGQPERIELEYETSCSESGVVREWQAVPPVLNGRVTDSAVFWRFPTDIVPISGQVTLIRESVDGATDRRQWRQSDATGGILVVRIAPLEWASALVALAIVWMGWSRSDNQNGRWLLIAAILLCLAAVVVPPPLGTLARWPILSLLILFVRGRSQFSGILLDGARAPRKAVATAAIAGAVWLGGPTRAAAPSPTIVYILPAVGDREGREMALAPVGLIDRLWESIRNQELPDSPIAVSAKYTGSLHGAEARFRAELTLHGFSDEPRQFVLPLTGINFSEIRLDGKIAIPTPNGERLVVMVAGRERHQLEVDFAVACAAGPERELRFAVPELPQSRLLFVVPGRPAHLRAIAWRGAQAVRAGAGDSTLECDLGRVSAVHIRWSGEAPVPPPAIRADEAFLWNFQDGSSRLLGTIRWAIENGRTTTLDVRVPPELEVAAVRARPLDLAAGATPTAWLEDWQVRGAPGRLTLTFSAPISGVWQTTCEFVPRNGFDHSFDLPLPESLGVVARKSTYAWRSRQHNLATETAQGVTELPPAEFLRSVWAPARVEPDPRMPGRASRRDDAGPAPRIRVTTIMQPVAATEAFVWTLGRRSAGFTNTLHITAAEPRFSVLEWLVPAQVEIGDVTGADLFKWNRNGDRLQVWLQRPATEAEVSISGHLIGSFGKDRLAELPSIRMLNANVDGTIRVSPQRGLGLKPVELRDVIASQANGVAGRDWEYRIAGPNPHIAVRVEREAPSPPAMAVSASSRETIAPTCEVAELTTESLANAGLLQTAVFAMRGTIDGGLQLTWPAEVRLLSAEWDSKRLPVPAEAVSTFSPAARRTANEWTIKLVWLQQSDAALPESGQLPEIAAGASRIVPARALWTVRASPGWTPASEATAESTASLLRLRAPFRTGEDARSQAAPSRSWLMVNGKTPALCWEPDSAPNAQSWLRVAALIGSLVATWLAKYLVGDALWPETLVLLAVSGWLATGGWVWLAPIVLGLFVRAQSGFDRRRLPAIQAGT